MKKLTDRQIKVIRSLKKDIFEHDGFNNPDKYEFKEWEVKITKATYIENMYHVFVSSIVGMKDDDGTSAALFCRRRRLFHIGPKGGVKGLLGKKVTGYHKALIWSYTH